MNPILQLIIKTHETAIARWIIKSIIAAASAGAGWLSTKIPGVTADGATFIASGLYFLIQGGLQEAAIALKKSNPDLAADIDAVTTDLQADGPPQLAVVQPVKPVQSVIPSQEPIKPAGPPSSEHPI